MGDSRDSRFQGNPPGSPKAGQPANPQRNPQSGAQTRPQAGASSREVAGAAARAGTSGKAGSAPAASDSARKDATTGRIVHDERGNAVWDWLKETSRIAIESTSRLLRKLETPELKVEDSQDEELRIESDRDQGGGYDPYNQRTPTRKIGRK